MVSAVSILARLASVLTEGLRRDCGQACVYVYQPHNWTDDMHNLYSGVPAYPVRDRKIVKRCELAPITAVQRVSSVQLVAQ